MNQEAVTSFDQCHKFCSKAVQPIAIYSSVTKMAATLQTMICKIQTSRFMGILLALSLDNEKVLNKLMYDLNGVCGYFCRKRDAFV